MQDSQLLSGFPESSGTYPVGRPGTQVFDACRAGVVLRAVIFVELVMSVTVMYGSSSVADWARQLAFMTGAALPATLSWLLLVCTLKSFLSRLRVSTQITVSVVAGALAGAIGCAVLSGAGLLSQRPPWIAASCSGGLLASVLVSAWILRARAATPASTAARLAELQARIQPHFLFNTLNSAVALVRAEPARAEALLEDLSDLFRHALDDHGEAVSLAQEIDLARRYLAIEKVRFGDRLQLEWSIDKGANTAMLPPLLLQPLLENAVKHGVEPSEAGARIWVSAERRGTRVVIKVINNVPSGQGSPGFGLALDNVRDRLALLHDLEGQFRAGFRDGLFQVRIEVPA